MSVGAIQEQILHTGQHFDAAMSDQFFTQLGIPQPAFHLGIGGGSHDAQDTDDPRPALPSILTALGQAPLPVLLECGTNRLADPEDPQAIRLG